MTMTTPRNDTESRSALALVQDFLAVAICEATGRDDATLDDRCSPMQLGIDSLMIMQINNKLRRSLGVDLPNNLFFDPDATLAQLAAYVVEQADSARVKALETSADAEDISATIQGPATTATADATSIGLTTVAAAQPTQPLSDSAAGLPAADAPSGAGWTLLESLMQQQLKAFAELTQQQMEAFQQTGAPVATSPVPVPTQAFSPANAAAPQPQVATNVAPQQQMQVDQSDGEHKPFSPYRPVADASSKAGPTVSDVALGELTRDFCAQSQTTKARTQTDRQVFANNRNIAGFTPAQKEMTYQIIAERAAGAYIWDLDGNRYVDLTQGFGSSLLGHAHPLLTEALRAQLDQSWAVGPISNGASDVARRICRMTGAERVAFYNSGTEAVMVAARLARTATGRPKVVIFEGAYHGMCDGLLAIADRSADAPGAALPMAPGITERAVADTLVLPYDDATSLRVIEERADEIAAVIVEPVQSRRPDQQPRAFLRRLRALTERIGSALIFDEVVTGFRTAPGGAQAWFGVRADIAAYGKVVGGSMPVGIIAGNARFMDGIDGGMWAFGDDSRPQQRNTYVAGTFCSHPLTMASARAILTYLEEQGPALQRGLNARTRRLCAQLNNIFADLGLPIHTVQFASLFRFVLPKVYELFFYRLQVAGVYVWEGRNCLLSTAHDDAAIEQIVAAVRSAAEWLLQSIDAGAARHPVGFGAEEAPVSAAQRVMFERAQRPNSSEAYHVPAVFVVEGALDVECFERALTELCARHESLRTAFVERDGVLYQRIHPVAGFELHIGDAIDENGINALVQPLLAPFDLTLPGLLRCAVAPLRSERERHLLALNMHHLIADGVSVGVLVEELLTLVSGGEPGATTASYRDYVAWEQAYLDSPDAQRDEALWRERLADLPRRVELPQSMSTAESRAFGCRRIGLDLSNPARLHAFAREHGVTMNMFLQALFQVWLSVVSGRDELFYGSPTAGRPEGRFDTTIGLFIGVIVYRARIEPGRRFADLLDAVRTATTEMLGLQHIPFERIQRLLPDPGDGGTPFEVGINYDGQIGAFEVGDLRVTPQELDGRPGMSLSCVLDLRDIGDRLRLDIAHDPELYSQDAVVGWAALFDRLAQALTTDPERPIGEIAAAVANDTPATNSSRETAL